MAAAGSRSPRNSSCGDASAAFNSPQSKQGAAARVAASPWTHVVRGAESESIVSSSAASAATAVASPSSPLASSVAQGQINNSSLDWSPSKAAVGDSSSSSLYAPDNSTAEAQLESSDNGTGSSNAAKKPVWNRPSNGAVDVGPVMGAVSWPALSESTRASPKSSSSDSLKSQSDGSVYTSQGTGTAPSSTPKSVITNDTNPSSSPNHVAAARQKPMKRGAGTSSGNAIANGGFPQPSPPIVEMPSNNTGKSGPAVPESSSRDHIHKEGGQRGGFGSQSHNSGNDQPQQRNSFRRGNGNSHPRGDGSYRHNYGGRRDQDGGNHEWNSHRNFNGRDPHMQPQRVFPRTFIRPPPHSSTPFIPPPPVHVRPFANPMVYADMSSPQLIYVPAAPPPEHLRGGVPIVGPIPPPVYFPLQDPQLASKILSQIDYYFSNENLIKDTFLRQNMDDQGWVSIKLIAGFKRVMELTDNIQLILDVVRTSSVVELQGDKIRKRDDWSRWIMLPAPFANVPSPQSLGRSYEQILAVSMRNISLEERANEQSYTESFLSRSSSGDLNSHSQPSTSDGMIQGTVQSGLARSLSK